MPKICGALMAVVVCVGALAQGGAVTLDGYLNNLHTLRTTFLQTLIDAHGREIDRSTGTLIVVRPGKLRWEVRPAGAKADAGQLLVADGRNLWFLDRDLQQVTVKPADAALSATPAMLLSGTVDVRRNFKISAAGERDGLDWALVEPRGAAADFRRALFGFRRGELQRLILDDKLGQTATIVLQNIQRNGPVAAAEVAFTPPAGVDIIGKPQP